MARSGNEKNCKRGCGDGLAGAGMLGTTEYGAANGAAGVAGNVFQQNAGDICQASAGSHGGGAGEGGSDGQPAAVFADGEPTAKPATEFADIRNRVGADALARS